jgi:conjugative transposon TraN protein
MQYDSNKLFMVITGTILALLILPACRSFAQAWDVKAQSASESQAIEITYNKTTSLVFPAIIKSVDRGSRDILAQKAKGVENILQLKAARHGFPQTNLTVITGDGNIHQFTVHYTKDPNQLVLKLPSLDDTRTAEEPTPPLLWRGAGGEAQMEIDASKIVNAKRSIRFVNESKYKIRLSLRGIYIRDNIIFYHFRVSNQSNINYDVDFLRIYVQDKQKVKRTASQEVNIQPIYVLGSADKIKGRTTQEVVYALEKFTIPDAKRLVIEMFEKNGGRNLSLSIKNKTIVNARLVD